MLEGKEEFGKAVFDRRFGSMRHLLEPFGDIDDVTHAIKAEAVELLLESLDCLHDAMADMREGKEVDRTTLLALQERLQGIVRMQRLLRVNENEK